jgi:hypothetical protein
MVLAASRVRLNLRMEVYPLVRECRPGLADGTP